jgi:cysteine desulfurase
MGQIMKKYFSMGSGAKDALGLMAVSHVIDVVRQTGRNQFLNGLSDDIPFLEELGCIGKRIVPNEKGQITKDVVFDLIKPRVSLIALPWIDPQTGVIHPIHDLYELAREHNIVLLIDATDAIGVLDLSMCQADIILIAAGLFSDRKIRSYNSYSDKTVMEFIETRENLSDQLLTESARLRSRFEEQIARFATVLYKSSERAPHMSAVDIAPLHSDALLFYLERSGVSARAIDERRVSLTFSPDLKGDWGDAFVKAIDQLRLIGGIS